MTDAALSRARAPRTPLQLPRGGAPPGCPRVPGKAGRADKRQRPGRKGRFSPGAGSQHSTWLQGRCPPLVPPRGLGTAARWPRGAGKWPSAATRVRASVALGAPLSSPMYFCLFLAVRVKCRARRTIGRSQTPVRFKMHPNTLCVAPSGTNPGTRTETPHAGFGGSGRGLIPVTRSRDVLLSRTSRTSPAARRGAGMAPCVRWAETAITATPRGPSGSGVTAGTTGEPEQGRGKGER